MIGPELAGRRLCASGCAQIEFVAGHSAPPGHKCNLLPRVPCRPPPSSAAWGTRHGELSRLKWFFVTAGGAVGERRKSGFSNRGAAEDA
ncbi:hypothetical protein niasHT_018495 [Heterodera trifolii]|uniref:Uncharacterized protein n=1 Tax=Heterodera trifolii TaxID=157864 RepID=A0ABD2K457_9BILA